MSKEDATFIVPLPGGRVARVPLAVLEQYADAAARACHGAPDAPADDVTAHNVILDRVTGASVWHTEWELGQCDYTDESGFPQSTYAWHRHPLGNEYTELYQR